jgi:hypothetical protein
MNVVGCVHGAMMGALQQSLERPEGGRCSKLVVSLLAGLSSCSRYVLHVDVDTHGLHCWRACKHPSQHRVHGGGTERRILDCCMPHVMHWTPVELTDCADVARLLSTSAYLYSI